MITVAEIEQNSHAALEVLHVVLDLAQRNLERELHSNLQLRLGCLRVILILYLKISNISLSNPTIRRYLR